MDDLATAQGTTIDAQARDWVYRLADDPALASECRAWRAQSPAHEAAFTAVWAVWQAAPRMDVVVDQSWRAEVQALARKRAIVGHLRYMIPLAVAAGIAAVAVMSPLTWVTPDVSVRTKVAETQVLTLADGSHVTVGAQSDVDVTYDNQRREVRLDSGQAFFEVAPDPARPFTVIAGGVEVLVTGTKFDVQRIGDHVAVNVLEGRVELRHRSIVAALRQQAPQEVLTAGKRVEARGNQFTPPQTAAVTPGAWREGWLYYAEAPLADIIADASRYSTTPIKLGDRRVGEMRLTTSLRTDQIAEFLADLETTLPVKSRTDAAGAVTITAR